MKEKLKCEDGFEPCEKCSGVGWVSMIESDPDCEYARPCPLCKGEGVVDWVRIIMGYAKPKEISINTTAQWKINPVPVKNFKYFRKE